MDNGQAHAHPLSDFLGGEKWLENAIQDVLFHPASGVIDAEFEIGPGPEIRMTARGKDVHHHILEFLSPVLLLIQPWPGTRLRPCSSGFS